MISFKDCYTAYEKQREAEASKSRSSSVQDSSRNGMCAMESFMKRYRKASSLNPTLDNILNPSSCNGFIRMDKSRLALECMDRQGWERSYFQKKFHDAFLQATARVYWKKEGQGQFARDHQKILEMNGWDHLAQEILISTPRRFGKTISVSMFCACVLFGACGAELSIYSTCKRISQKLLRNVRKFLDMVFQDLKIPGFRVIRENQEEIVLQGPEGKDDVRICNSYPSRVSAPPQNTLMRHKRRGLATPWTHHGVYIVHMNNKTHVTDMRRILTTNASEPLAASTRSTSMPYGSTICSRRWASRTFALAAPDRVEMPASMPSSVNTSMCTETTLSGWAPLTIAGTGCVDQGGLSPGFLIPMGLTFRNSASDMLTE